MTDFKQSHKADKKTDFLLTVYKFERAGRLKLIFIYFGRVRVW